MSRAAKWHVTTAQSDVLCTFFEENPEVIRGYKKTPNGVGRVQSKWRRITPHLNSLGAERDHRSWAKYVCNVKGKLKRKRMKWKQNSDGTEATLCNPDDFNEIELRMIQVLRHSAAKEIDTKVNNSSDTAMEDNTNDDENSADAVAYPWHDTKAAEDTEYESTYIAIENDCPQLDLHQQVNANNKVNRNSELDSSKFNDNEDDEFDTFGKNVAQQLRAMRLHVALETQEMLLSVLRKQRLKSCKRKETKHRK